MPGNPGEGLFLSCFTTHSAHSRHTIKSHVDCCNALSLDWQGCQLIQWDSVFTVTTAQFICVSHYSVIHYLFLCSKHVPGNGHPKKTRDPHPHLPSRSKCFRRFLSQGGGGQPWGTSSYSMGVGVDTSGAPRSHWHSFS